VRELLVAWKFSIDDKALSGLESSLGDIASIAKTVGVAVVGAAGTLFGLAENARRTIDDLDEMAQAVGVNTQFFAEFSAAAQLGGASTEDSAAAIAKFSKNIVEAREGNKAAAQSFKELGISQADLQRLPTEALLARLADGMKGIEDPAKRVALAQELLGRGGRKLIPTLVGGAAEMAKLGDQAREFGLVPGPEAIKAANDMELAMARAMGVVSGLGLTVGTALMPVVTDIAKRFANWAKENRAVILTKLDAFVSALTVVVQTAWDATVGFVGAMRSLLQFFRDNKSATSALLAITTALVAAFAVQKVMQFIAALKALRMIMLGVNIAMAANPIGLLFVLLAVLVALWVANWDDIKEVTLFAWEAIKQAARDALAFLKGVWASISATASETWEGMKLAFRDTVTAFQQAWQGVFDWYMRTVINPIFAAWDRAKGIVSQVGEFLGFGGGGGAGHSPGRPGSPESKVSPLSTSSGVGRAGGGVASRSVIVQSAINISVPAGMSTTEREGLESRLRRAARDEFDRATREALAEMA